MRQVLKLFLLAAVATACSDPTAAPVTLTSAADAPLAGSTADLEAPHYTPSLLPRLRNELASAALAVNAAGFAAGATLIPAETRFPGLGGGWPCRVVAATIFRAYDATSLHDALYKALGVYSPCDAWSIATDINDRDEVVGIVWDPMEYSTHYGFFWSAKTGVKLFKAIGPTLLTGMNNNGATVGWYDSDGYGSEALVYWWPNQGGTAPPLPFFRYMWAWDINNDGVTAGCWNMMAYKLDAAGHFTTNEEYCNYVSSLLTLSLFHLPDAGGINGGGTSVYTNGKGVPVMWGAGNQKGVPVGWAPGAASGISDRGRVVGWQQNTSAPLSVAMTRASGGRILALPGLPSGSATEAYAVNKCGHVVGATFDTGNAPHAIVWKTSRCDTP